jgi:hypothetical protein
MHIDHIDCNKHNNRLENLRAVDPLVNARNRIPPKNQSGYPNVHWSRKAKAWRADISIADKIVWQRQSQDARRLYNRFLEAKAMFHGADSLRHYPGPIDLSHITVAKQQQGGDGRGAVRITKPRPGNWDYWYRVMHRGKTVLRTKDFSEATEYAINLRASLDNAR